MSSGQTGFYVEERERVLGARPVLDAAGWSVSPFWFAGLQVDVLPLDAILAGRNH